KEAQEREAARDRALARKQAAEDRSRAEYAAREDERKAVLERQRQTMEEEERQPMKLVTVGNQTFYTPETQGLTARQRQKFLPKESQMTMGPDEAALAGSKARGAEEAEFQQFGRSAAERRSRHGGARAN